MDESIHRYNGKDCCEPLQDKSYCVVVSCRLYIVSSSLNYIERDSKQFELILDYLEDDLDLSDCFNPDLLGLLDEAEYYGLIGLVS